MMTLEKELQVFDSFYDTKSHPGRKNKKRRSGDGSVIIF